jgi:DNA-directed RNA polymerase beta subunit
MVLNVLLSASSYVLPVFIMTLSKIPVAKSSYGTTVIPNRGAWIEYETDLNDIIYARVDRTRKLPATIFCVRAMGLEKNADIVELCLVIPRTFGKDLGKRYYHQ